MKDLKPHSPTLLDNIIPTPAPTLTPSTTLINHRRPSQKVRRQHQKPRIIRRPLIRHQIILRLLLLGKTRAPRRITHPNTSTASIERIRDRRHPLAQLVRVDELNVCRKVREHAFCAGGQSHRGTLDFGQFAHERLVQLVIEMRGGPFRKNGNAVWLAYLQGRMASSSSSSHVGGDGGIASFNRWIGALEGSFLIRISRIIFLR